LAPSFSEQGQAVAYSTTVYGCNCPLSWTASKRIGALLGLGAVPNGTVQVASTCPRLVRFVLRGDGQSPSNWPLGRRVPWVSICRERLGGLGDDLTATSPASIDSRMNRRFSGSVLFVELRTDADFYVVAAPEQRHDRPPSSITLAPTTWRALSMTLLSQRQLRTMHRRSSCASEELPNLPPAPPYLFSASTERGALGRQRCLSAPHSCQRSRDELP
jgi:hypothetical protein